MRYPVSDIIYMHFLLAPVSARTYTMPNNIQSCVTGMVIIVVFCQVNEFAFESTQQQLNSRGTLLFVQGLNPGVSRSMFCTR
jgi:hypothetical protein